jgi:hypothetical protein
MKRTCQRSADPHASFSVTVFARLARLQHIAFLFSIEKIRERRKQKVKELHPPRESKNMRQ